MSPELALQNFWNERSVRVSFGMDEPKTITVGRGDWSYTVEREEGVPLDRQTWVAVFDWVQRLPSLPESELEFQ
jgi:hypothetical protein